MKRLFLLTPLTFVVVLLTGCPDTKLPSPTPKAPEPKTESALLYHQSESGHLNQNFDRLAASRRS